MRFYILFTMLFLSAGSLFGQKTITIEKKCINEATLDLRTGSTHYKSPEEILDMARSKGARVSPGGYRWIDRISNLPAGYSDFYDTYLMRIHDVVDNGQKNWTTDYSRATLFDNGRYGVRVCTYTGTVTFNADMAGDLNAQINDRISPLTAANWDEATAFMNFVCMSLSYDIPEAFWIDSKYSWANTASATASISGTTITATYEQDIYLMLKSSTFDIRRKDLATETKIMSEVTNFNNAISNILSTVADKSTRYETLLGLNNWLTSHNHYNTNVNTASSLAWSPLSSLCALQAKNAPVCEGYARAFMVLCNKLGIPCVLSTGDAKESRTSRGEAHMWNEVQMENDLWYAVDVTWNDPLDTQGRNVSGYETTKWFLLGSDDTVNTNWTFSQSHPKTIPWPVEDRYLNMWDYDISSLITNTGYGTPTVISPSTTMPSTSTGTVFSLDGRQLSSKASTLPKGIYIVNGKKQVNCR